MKGGPILQIQEITKTFGGIIALNRVSFEVGEGEILGIIGPNGSGKTTTVNCITGFVKPSSGRVLFRGEEITGKPPHKIADMGIPIITGAQDVSHLAPGKHTGEITANMLGELVSYCIVGHSERRRDFNETSDMVAEKTKLLLENSITPIVCLDLPYLDEQIKALFQNNIDVSRCFFVYEPVSAVGTGCPIDPIDANHTANQISFLIDNVAPILYGGSVTADNVKSFVDQSRIDGVLVGTDSLEPTLFAGIINSLT